MHLKDNIVQKSKIFVVIYCAIIAFIVGYVMVFHFSPNQNTLGALGSVCMDIVCIFLTIILIINLAFEYKRSLRSSTLYLFLLLGTLFALFFDFITWALDGNLAYSNWTYVATTASLCSGSILAAILVMYLACYVDDVYHIKAPYTSAHVCVVCNIISFIITLTLAITKTAFSLDDGHYTTGVLYDVITVIPILTLLYMTIYLIRHIKIIGIHDFIAVIAYLSTMVFGALLEASYSIGTTYVAIAIADVIIFSMLQNKTIEHEKRQRKNLSDEIDNQTKALASMAGILENEKKNVQKWRTISTTDELTGFFNRYAYEDEITKLGANEIPEDFVYVSIDINGLKTINDTLGHIAGDELIVGACECLDICLGKYGKLYRIGGDEFVALIYADEQTLKKIQANIKKETQKWCGEIVDHLSVSCGYVLFKEAKKLTIQQIAILADKRMYEEKSLFYQQHGIDRRSITY